MFRKVDEIMLLLEIQFVLCDNVYVTLSIVYKEENDPYTFCCWVSQLNHHVASSLLSPKRF